MSTKVCIIDVSLDADISKIISEDLDSITQETQTEFNNAMEVAKAITVLKEQKINEKATIETKVAAVYQAAYDRLVGAGTTGVLDTIIMEIVVEITTQKSAFTTRMKTFLRKLGNPYRIVRVKRSNGDYYVFEPFNEVEETDAQDNTTNI